jgi:hypothetical protein
VDKVDHVILPGMDHPDHREQQEWMTLAAMEHSAVPHVACLICEEEVQFEVFQKYHVIAKRECEL